MSRWGPEVGTSAWRNDRAAASVCGSTWHLLRRGSWGSAAAACCGAEGAALTAPSVAVGMAEAGLAATCPPLKAAGAGLAAAALKAEAAEAAPGTWWPFTEGS